MQVWAPYPWFGGKRTIAAQVWRRFGDVDRYVEPFFGGGAVFFARPKPQGVEVINDADGFVVNFLRAVQAAPLLVEELIAAAPHSELELEAHHRWLCRIPEKHLFLERLRTDRKYYDVERAAWWCLGLSLWIGIDWCAGEFCGEDPARSSSTVAVGRYRRPTLKPQGVTCDRDWPAYFAALAQRLAKTRITCGDFRRVLTKSALSGGGRAAVFLDPPYSAAADRTKNLYRCDESHAGEDLAAAAREWCLAHSRDARLRIALCGYDSEHRALEKRGWKVLRWKAPVGYTRSGNRHSANRTRERIWFSPSTG